MGAGPVRAGDSVGTWPLFCVFAVSAVVVVIALVVVGDDTALPVWAIVIGVAFICVGVCSVVTGATGHHNGQGQQ